MERGTYQGEGLSTKMMVIYRISTKMQDLLVITEYAPKGPTATFSPEKKQNVSRIIHSGSQVPRLQSYEG